jgi:hypothetical protein
MTTQNLSFNPGDTKYYINCRGANYLPVMESEWAKSGHLPRYPELSVFGFINPGQGFPTSASFQGVNKISQWWYYNSDDNDRCLSLLRGIGMNSIRVFTDIYVWARDRDKFWNSINDFHRLCDKHKIRVQWVIWDGVFINQAPQPTNRSQTVSSLEHGLVSQWRAVPHDFEVSSQAQAENFFTTCAVPFIDEFAQNTSAYQSLWSIDLKNEGPSSMVWLTSATGLRFKSLLSSIDVKYTIGHGAGYDPYNSNEALDNGLGEGPGGTYSHYPNFIYQLSSVIDFGSIHPYTSNRYSYLKYLRESVSGAQQIGLPAMINESHFPDNFSWIRDELRITSSFEYGVMGFDALIDYSYSFEPFRDSQGVLFIDGTARSKRDADTYVEMASSTNWFSPLQLNLNIVEKSTSVDNGFDEGYWSGVNYRHGDYNPLIHVSTTLEKYELAKQYYYNTSILAKISPIGRSTNYPTFQGHPMAQSFSYGFTSSGINFKEARNILNNFKEYFPPLSSLPDANSGPVFEAKNRSIVLRSLLLGLLSTHPLELVRGIPWSELRGSQFDENPIPVADRYAFSAAFDAIYTYGVTPNGLGDYSTFPSISPGVNNRQSSWDNVPCNINGTCLKTVAGAPTGYADLDWNAYDAYFDDCVDKLKTCFSHFDVAAELDDNFRLA